MTDTLEIQAALTTTPAVGNPSGVASVTIPVDLSVSLVNKSVQQFDLTADSPVSVDMSMLPNGANVLQIQTIGGRVRARITNEFGSQQAVGVDAFYLQVDQSGSITAIDLTRDAGVETNVYVFLGALN